MRPDLAEGPGGCGTGEEVARWRPFMSVPGVGRTVAVVRCPVAAEQITHLSSQYKKICFGDWRCSNRLPI